MALKHSSSIQPFRFEAIKNSFKSSAILLLIWALWLVFVSTLNIPLRLSVSGASVILLVGAFWWSYKEGAFYVLLMSLIFGALSLMPSGLYWCSAYAIFALLRLASFRFSVSSGFQVALAVFAISFLLDFIQAIMLRHILLTPVMSGRLLASIFYSGLIQSLLSWALAIPILTLIEAK